MDLPLALMGGENNNKRRKGQGEEGWVDEESGMMVDDSFGESSFAKNSQVGNFIFLILLFFNLKLHLSFFFLLFSGRIIFGRNPCRKRRGMGKRGSEISRKKYSSVCSR